MEKRVTQLFFISVLVCLGVSLLPSGTAADPVKLADVKERLNELGYDPGAIDNTWNETVKAAIEKYQIDHKLPITREWDRTTLQSLGLASTPAQPTPAAASTVAQAPAGPVSPATPGGNSLAEIEAEERSIVRDIRANGIGSRLTIPGIKTETGSPCAITISEAGGSTWSLKMELPSDQLPIRNSSQIVFGEGSIHRFSGEVRYDNEKLPKFVGEGDKANRLTFLLLALPLHAPLATGPLGNTGYVYVRGKGKLVYPDGRVVELGGASQQ